jgi:hypothetical protein
MKGGARAEVSLCVCYLSDQDFLSSAVGDVFHLSFRLHTAARMAEKIFSGILLGIATTSSALFTFAIIGISITPSGLKEAPWIEAMSDGTIMAVGRIFGGSNAIFIEGEDSDVLKYVDCKDMFEFCKSCGSISSTTTFLVAVTLLASFVSIIFSALAIFSTSTDHKRSVLSFVTSLLGLLAYVTFQHCYLGFRTSDGVLTSDTKQGDGLWCLFYGFIFSGFHCLLSAAIKILESNGVVSFRSPAVYMTTEIRVRSRSDIPPPHQV